MSFSKVFSKRNESQAQNCNSPLLSEIFYVVKPNKCFQFINLLLDTQHITI